MSLIVFDLSRGAFASHAGGGGRDGVGVGGRVGSGGAAARRGRLARLASRARTRGGGSVGSVVFVVVVEREPRQVKVLVEVLAVVEEDKVAVLLLHGGDGRLDDVEGVGLFAPVIGLAEPVGGLGHGARPGGRRLCGESR